MSAPAGAEPATGAEVSWFWDWVPAAGRDAAMETAWREHMAALFAGWVGAKVNAARAAWPADSPVRFPFSGDELGSELTGDLLVRADDLPRNCRLAWGAAFIDDNVRWLPLLVVVEFRPATADDPAYLMAAVGAEGLDDDIREPTIDYVSTEHGDGVRVLALARTKGDGLHGRVNAALRLQGPAQPIDVLLSTRVTDLGQLAAIGGGMELLMAMVAGQVASSELDVR